MSIVPILVVLIFILSLIMTFCILSYYYGNGILATVVDQSKEKSNIEVFDIFSFTKCNFKFIRPSHWGIAIHISSVRCGFPSLLYTHLNDIIIHSKHH